MYLHEVSRDCEPQPESAMLASRRAVSLSKSIEDVRQKLLADALASIRNTHLNRSASPRHFHANTPAAVQ